MIADGDYVPTSDHWIGVVCVPIGEAMRMQLGLPKGQPRRVHVDQVFDVPLSYLP